MPVGAQEGKNQNGKENNRMTSTENPVVAFNLRLAFDLIHVIEGLGFSSDSAAERLLDLQPELGLLQGAVRSDCGASSGFECQRL